MTQVIRLKTNYPEYRLQSVRLDNTAEFSSRTFNDYCMTQGIEVQHCTLKMVWPSHLLSELN
jgi:hypothetical protein